MNERKRRRRRRDGDDSRAKARYWFPVILPGLRHLTAFRYYQEPISMSRLFIPRTGQPRNARAAFVCRRGHRADAAWISAGKWKYRVAWKKLSRVEGWEQIVSIEDGERSACLPLVSKIILIKIYWSENSDKKSPKGFIINKNVGYIWNKFILHNRWHNFIFLLLIEKANKNILRLLLRKNNQCSFLNRSSLTGN